MPTQQDIQSILPLTEATFFIMLSLSSGPAHGYAIMKDVSALSDRRVVLSTGTLYGVLKRLLRDRWIRRVEDASGTEDSGRPRKLYVLTDLGRRILEAEAERLRSLVRATQQLRSSRERV